MKPIRNTSLVALAGALFLAACNTSPVPFEPPSAMLMSELEAPDEAIEFAVQNGAAQNAAMRPALVRGVHLSPDAPAVDVFIDDGLVTEDLAYTQFVGPAEVPAGMRNIKVKAANTNTTVIDANLDLEAGRRYSVYAAGKLAQIAPLVFEDTRFAARKAAKLRVLHGSASAPRVDVYLSRPGTPLDKIDPVLENIPFKSISSYFRLRPGGLQVRVTLPDTKTVVIDSGALEIREGNIFTAVAIDKPGKPGEFSAIVIDERKVNPPTITPPQSIVEIASGNPDFSTLVGALKSADLVGALSGPGPFTVFAPTNDAFKKLSSIPGGDALKNVLLYHVASGSFDAAKLLELGEVTTLQGQKIGVKKVGNDVILNDAVKVTTANIKASNGIIHVIDTVLIPAPPLKSIAEIAAGDAQFSTLVAALNAANLVDPLAKPGFYTVFAPTNDAFKKLSSIPGGDALKNVLLYHVASGVFDAAKLVANGDLVTLQGQSVKITRDVQGNVILNGLVKVIAADIKASNGIVHVIDTVLIPPTSQVRAIHASSDAPAVNVLVDGAAAFRNLVFGKATAYASVPSGTRNIKVNVASNGATAINANLNLAKDITYTVIALNRVARIEALVLNDTADGNSTPASGKTKVRLIHGASQAGLVDVYVTAPNTDIGHIDPTLRDFAFKANTKYLELNAGNYRVRITPPHSKHPVIDTGAINLASGGVYTGVALDPAPRAHDFGALLVRDN